MASATRPVSARREATRSRLLTAASEAFAERGFYGTSVEDICERAGFTRGAFYSNFASREELVIELSSQRTAVIRDRLRELTNDEKIQSPTDLLHGVLALWGGDTSARRQFGLLQLEFSLHAIRDRETGEAWSAHLSRSQEEIAEVLREYRTRNGIALPVADLDLARLLFAVFLGGSTQHLANPDLVGEEQLENAFVTLVEHAIAR